MASLGLGAVFLSLLYQNLLLTSLVLVKPEIGFRTVEDVADAIVSGKYTWYMSKSSGFTNTVCGIMMTWNTETCWLL